jgi:ABC-type antimicrobial peptide transport system permease subunit
MLKNYLITAWRSLWKRKFFSLVNVLGLSIGISAALVIWLIVNYEFSYDRFEADRSRIYRVVVEINSRAGGSFFVGGVENPFPEAVAKEVGGLDLVVPFRTWQENATISLPPAKGGKPTVYKDLKDVVFADDAFFKLVPYEWVAGSKPVGLTQPYHVVLTASRASLFFPGVPAEQVIGRALFVKDTIPLVVTGVVKDLRQLTDFNFGVFVSRAILETPDFTPQDGEPWGSINHESQLFVKLSSNASVGQIEEQLAVLFSKYHPIVNKGSSSLHRLQPLSDLHFNVHYNNFDQRRAHRPTLLALSVVAVFLLVLACINFINLTTAQASLRAKEIGIRKTMGGSMRQLMGRFLGETFLLTIAATVLSALLTPLLLAAFADFIPPGLSIVALGQPATVIFLMILLVVVTLLAGAYPAFVLSAGKPALVLKDNRRGRSVLLRKGLTVAQFVIAQVLIIGSIIIAKQVNYTLNKDLGFRKDAILVFHTPYNDPKHQKLILLERIRNIPQVSMVSLSNNPPSSERNNTQIDVYSDGKKEIETSVISRYVDSNYMRLYGLRLLAGRPLPYSDTVQGLLINETYARALGFVRLQDAVGKTIMNRDRPQPIYGVVADFHEKSLHEPIQPMVMGCWPKQEIFINVALKPQDRGGTLWAAGIANLERAWKDIYPGEDIDYSFLDETIAKFYTAERHITHLLFWATSLAIIISCLGLSGLVLYITTQRAKEISIRKVVGASVPQLVSLLSADFLKLVFIAFAIAVPIGWYGVHEWLEGFAYKTELSGWNFLAGGLIMLVIALFTLGLRTVRAANANPVDNLRAE